MSQHNVRIEVDAHFILGPLIFFVLLTAVYLNYLPNWSYLVAILWLLFHVTFDSFFSSGICIHRDP